MPTYEYECTECGHRFDVFQSIKDDPVENCEKCGKTVRRLFNPTGIIFKGSGFYVNDYKKNSSSSSNQTNSKSCPKDSGSDSCKNAV